jgi:hypothetical protein
MLWQALARVPVCRESGSGKHVSECVTRREEEFLAEKLEGRTNCWPQYMVVNSDQTGKQPTPKVVL